MKVLTLDLLRHGEAEGADRYRGRIDPPLTPEGMARMLQWGSEWGGENPGWQHILSSPLHRCREAARRIARQLALEVDDEPALIEYDFGTWDGRRYDEVWQDDRPAVLAFWQDPDAHPPPGGETIAALCHRIGALEQRLLRQSAEHLLLVTHGGVIRALIGRRLQLPPSAWSQLRIDTGSLSRVKIGYDRQQYWFELSFLNRLPQSRSAG